MDKKFIVWTLLITAAAVIGVYFTGRGITSYKERSSMHKFEAVVQRVIDGDTVVTDGGEKIRLLGVDTPELHHPDFPEQPFAREAMQYTKERVDGKKCVFEYTNLDHYDKYGRTLAFIYADGSLVNSELVKKGLGYASINKHLSRTREFMVVESIAKKFRLGIWQYKDGGQEKK
jgi:micrococcal nuclease